jgi:hypothetical protein
VAAAPKVPPHKLKKIVDGFLSKSEDINQVEVSVLFTSVSFDIIVVKLNNAS